MREIQSLPRSFMCSLLIGILCSFSLILSLPSPALAISASDAFAVGNQSVTNIKGNWNAVDLSVVEREIKRQLDNLETSLEDSITIAGEFTANQAGSIRDKLNDAEINEYLKNFHPKDRFELLHALEKLHSMKTPSYLRAILGNQLLIKDINILLNATPGSFCASYYDMKGGIDNARWMAIQESAGSIFAMANAIATASAAGAGPLAGYAGIASVVSHMGLGSLTTTLASLLGTNVSGAAATAVVTSTVGGPLVMGIILAGGTGTAVYGTYKLGRFTTSRFDHWTEGYCNAIVPLGA